MIFKIRYIFLNNPPKIMCIYYTDPTINKIRLTEVLFFIHKIQCYKELCMKVLLIRNLKWVHFILIRLTVAPSFNFQDSTSLLVVRNLMGEHYIVHMLKWYTAITTQKNKINNSNFFNKSESTESSLNNRIAWLSSHQPVRLKHHHHLPRSWKSHVAFNMPNIRNTCIYESK